MIQRAADILKPPKLTRRGRFSSVAERACRAVIMSTEQVTVIELCANDNDHVE